MGGGGGMMSLIFKPFLEGSWEGGGGGYTSVKKNIMKFI